MKKMLSATKWVAVAALAASSCLRASAADAVIYSNTNNDTGFRASSSSGSWYGSTVIGTPGTGSAPGVTYGGVGQWIVSGFAFQYYALHNTAPSGLMDWNTRVELFSGTPTTGTLVYDSGTFSMSSIGANSATAGTMLAFGNSDFATSGSPYYGSYSIGPAGNVVSGTGLLVPATSLTLAVQFSGIAAGDEVGFEFYGAPTVGNAYNSYWLGSVGGGGSVTWTEDTLPGATYNMVGAVVTATSVPEPGTLALAVLGGALLLGVRRQQRR